MTSKRKKLLAGAVVAALAVTPAAAQVSGGASAAFSGPVYIPLTLARNANGSAIAATAAGANDFVVSLTADTSLYLTGHQASSNTKTDTVVLEFYMPEWKPLASTLHVVIFGQYAAVASPGAGVVVAPKLQNIGTGDGTISAALTRLSGAASQSIGPTSTPRVWEFDTSAVIPGYPLLLTMTTTAGEGDGGTLNAQITGVMIY